MKFSPAHLVPNRSNRPGYQVNRRKRIIEDGSGSFTGAIIRPGIVIAVEEHVDHQRRVAEYTASTSDHFATRRGANPHLDLTAWFFRRVVDRWEFLGFGESPDSLWAEGTYARP